MKEQQLRKTLREIAWTALPAVPDHQAQILHEIKKEQAMFTPQRVSPALRRLRLAVILILILMLAATAYAVYQSQQPPITGTEGARDAGLVTLLNETQTIDDTTITLNYAYADGSQIAVNYSVTILDTQGEPRHADESTANAVRFRLRDVNGELLIKYPNGYRSEDFNGKHATTVLFTIPPEVSLPDQLDMIFEMVYDIPPRPARAVEVWSPGQLAGELIQLVRALDIFTVTKHFPQTVLQVVRAFYIWTTPMTGRIYSSITSADSSAARVQPESTSEPAPMEVAAGGIGPFTFEIKGVKPLPGITMHPNQSITVKQEQLTLDQVRVAPSKIEATLCWQEGSSHQWAPDWYNDVHLTVGDQVYTSTGGGSGGGSKRQPRYCTTYSFDVFTATLPESVLLRIGGFELPLQEAEWKKLEAKINDPKILRVDGNTITMNLEMSVLQTAKVELGYRIEGNWTFEVDLTQ